VNLHLYGVRLHGWEENMHRECRSAKVREKEAACRCGLSALD